MKAPKIKAPRAIRERKGMKQGPFWNRIGCTQSAGSRYESGRTIPPPVRILLKMATAPEAEAQALLAQVRSA